MNTALDASFELETPEHITFCYRLAGPARRGAAYLVDLFIRGVVLAVTAVIIELTSKGGNDDLRGAETGALLLIFFALEWGYFVAFDLLSNGASPGKKVFRLRVVHQDGRPISFSDSVLRNLLRAADLLPSFYAVGVLCMMLDSKFRRLGDFVAKTVVVHESLDTLDIRRPKDDVSEIEGLVARPRFSGAERDALLLFARRLPYLSRARGEELAEIVTPVFIQRYGHANANKVDLLIALGRRAR